MSDHFRTKSSAPPELRRRLEGLSKDSSLTPERFAVLLSALADEPEAAAQHYERLRRALVAFFEYRESRDPETDADETLNRAARRLSEGQLITAGNPASYFYGIARNLWRERLASHRPTVTLENAEPYTRTTPYHLLEEREQQREHEARLASMRECLQKFDPADHELLLAYYREQGKAKIDTRRALAEQLGIPPSALRLRLFRLREKLELCVKRGLSRR